MSDDLLIETVLPSTLVLQADDQVLEIGIACAGGDITADGVNVGGGEEVFRDSPTLGLLAFRTLVGGSGLVVAENGDVIEFSTAFSFAWNKDTFTPTTGQVTFSLSTAPTDLDSLELDVNGVTYEGGGVDYTVSGVTITWLNTEFSMLAGDRVVVRYR